MSKISLILSIALASVLLPFSGATLTSANNEINLPPEHFLPLELNYNLEVMGEGEARVFELTYCGAPQIVSQVNRLSRIWDDHEVTVTGSAGVYSVNTWEELAMAAAAYFNASADADIYMDGMTTHLASLTANGENSHPYRCNSLTIPYPEEEQPAPIINPKPIDCTCVTTSNTPTKCPAVSASDTTVLSASSQLSADKKMLTTKIVTTSNVSPDITMICKQ